MLALDVGRHPCWIADAVRWRRPGTMEAVHVGTALLLVGVVLAASIVVALGAARTGLPVLVAFLGLGMLLGSDGPGGIDFDDAELARRVGIDRARPDPLRGRAADLLAAPARGRRPRGAAEHRRRGRDGARHRRRRPRALRSEWLEAVLLGAVVASTDAAAVFSTLRFTHIRRRLARTLEAESGGNDPMAIALTLGLIAWIEHPDTLRHRRPAARSSCARSGSVWSSASCSAPPRRTCSRGSRTRSARSCPSLRSPRRRWPSAPPTRSAAAASSRSTSSGSRSAARPRATGASSSRSTKGIAFVAQVVLFIVLGLLVFPHDLRTSR